MAKWKLSRKHPDEADTAFAETGEVYDDAATSIDEYLELRKREDGWDYKADPI